MGGNIHLFEKIKGYKKFVYCKGCKKRIQVSNLNRYLCSQCGYRGSMFVNQGGITKEQIKGETEWR